MNCYHIKYNWKLYSRVRSTMCWSSGGWWSLEVDCQIWVLTHRSKRGKNVQAARTIKIFSVDMLSNFQARKNWSRRVRPNYIFPGGQGKCTNALWTISACPTQSTFPLLSERSSAVMNFYTVDEVRLHVNIIWHSTYSCSQVTKIFQNLRREELNVVLLHPFP